MKALKLYPDISNYRTVTPGCGTEQWMDHGRNLLAFSPAIADWNPPMFFWQANDSPIGDFFGTGDPALLGVNYSVRRSKRVWETLEAAGEFLPIEIEGFGEALLLHVMRTGKAVDWERSQTRKLSNGNVVVIRPVLRNSALPEAGIVRLEEVPAQAILIEYNDGRFQRNCAEHRLTGLYLEMLDSI